MKKLLLCAGLVCGILGYSQSVLWLDDFDDEDISDWTLIDADMDGNNWGDMWQIQNQFGDPVTPVSLISRSWQSVPLTPDNWAISPALDLTGASGEITLQFISQVAAASWDEEQISIYVATSNDMDALLNSSTQVTLVLGDAGHTGAPTLQTLDISALAGEPVVHIAFRHWGVTDMDFVSIDDVAVLAENLSTKDLSVAKSNMSLYPNPASDIVQISFEDDFDVSKAQISFTNISGKMVAKTAFSADGVNISNLPAGMYIVTATDGKNTVSKKLIKK